MLIGRIIKGSVFGVISKKNKKQQHAFIAIITDVMIHPSLLYKDSNKSNQTQSFSFITFVEKCCPTGLLDKELTYQQCGPSSIPVVDIWFRCYLVWQGGGIDIRLLGFLPTFSVSRAQPHAEGI